MATTFFKGGHFEFPTSGSTLNVTGLPFPPQAVLFLWTNEPVEDAWTQAITSPCGGGIGIAGVASASGDNTIRQMSYHEIWQGHDVGSALGAEVIMMRSSRSVLTYDFRASLASLNGDGFTLNLLNNPSGVRHIYWLAFGNFAKLATFQFGAAVTKALGFKPDGLFLIGGGGTADLPTRTYTTSTWLEAVVGGWDENDVNGFSSGGLGRGIFGFDPQQWNISHHDTGGDGTDFELLCLAVEPWVFGANISTWFQGKRGVDLASVEFNTFGFTTGYHEALIFGDCLVTGNAVGANGSVDVAQVVPLGATHDWVPQLVFLIGPQRGLNGESVASQSFGFRTDDFECCVAWGGQRELDSSGGAAGRFTSRSRSWVSGFSPPADVAPITDGQTDLGSTPGQFTITPKVSDNTNKTVWWAAYAPIKGPVLVSLSKPAVRSYDLSNVRG